LPAPTPETDSGATSESQQAALEEEIRRLRQRLKTLESQLDD